MRPGKRQHHLMFFVILFLTTACTVNLPGSTLLGRVHFTDSGGYEVQVVNEYTFEELEGAFEMLSPGSEPLIGPGFIGFGGLIEEERTNEDLWNFVTLDVYNDFQFEIPKPGKVDSNTGLISEFEGVQDGVSVHGKLFLTMVSEKHQFVLIGFAPEADWKKFEPIYDRVLKTVKFYIPNRTLILDNPYRRDIEKDEFNTTPRSRGAMDAIPNDRTIIRSDLD